MSVFALGLNHHTAPLDLRGRFAFTLEQLAPSLTGLRQKLPGAPEAAILSTCNRTEVYVAAPSAQVQSAIAWLAQAGGVEAGALREHAYVMQGSAAARHAFRVASGLDSMAASGAPGSFCRRPVSDGASCSNVNANRPRRSSGAVL